MNPVRDMALLPIEDTASVPADRAELQPSSVDLFERLARDKDISVEKIERLMALWERAEARKAEAAFNGAMSSAQAEIRPVAADADNPQTRSKYASYAALDRALRPIYTRHGFGLSFDTGDASEPDVRVLCYVTHAGGHSRTYHVDMPADGKGAKGGDVMTLTHATGSALSYGMRYLLKMIFNVAVGEGDDDGNAAGRKPEPAVKEPDGYDTFVKALESVSTSGTPTLMECFNKAPLPLRTYLTTKQGGTWNALKAVAASAKKSKVAK